MRRPHGPIVISLVLLAVVGCHEARPTVQYYGDVTHSHDAYCSTDAPRSALLFDRYPGEPTATAFNVRSDWPSVSAGRRARDTFYYVTYVNDRQGYGWNNYGYYYRSARYYQVGVEER